MNKDSKQSIRNLNGYRLIYRPNHFSSMISENWKGYVYEHVFKVESKLKRRLQDTEVVHHLDQNRSNNCTTNLLVLDSGQHAKLHAWIDRGAPGVKAPGKNTVNSKKPKECPICSLHLDSNQETYCSNMCRGMDGRKVVRPSLEDLIKDLSSTSYLAVGRKYSVSDNTVRKWVASYGHNKATLSQACEAYRSNKKVQRLDFE